MYREGPEGTPFHTLLAEGYVDGPVDVCLCISSESDLYKKWWPQTAIPSFKVLSSHCVKKIRAGEQISLVRMKVPWPLSSREALVHYFTYEYFPDGLVVVLLNTISDVENVDRSTHGFTRDGIPDAEDVVRIDVVGGFAVQMVGPDRSYFRTIANMDIKLDFVPPAFINFVARQLVSSGFRLYKKEVASVSKGDEDFVETLKDPHYTRIRQALYCPVLPTAVSLSPLRSKSILGEEQSVQVAEKNGPGESQHGDAEVQNEIEVLKDNDTIANESLDQNVQKSHDKLSNEIEEVRIYDEVAASEVEKAPGAKDETANHYGSEMSTRGDISPVVREALGTLEKVISILRDYNSKPRNYEARVSEGCDINLEGPKEGSNQPRDDHMEQEMGTPGESSNTRSPELTWVEPENLHESQSCSLGDSKLEMSQSKVAPASPTKSSHNEPLPGNQRNIVSEYTGGGAEEDIKRKMGGRKKRWSSSSSFCCFSC
ncbi:uncharacterized protein LOC127264858 isoform X2 [Andrographis paniculata]|nr:uncharacterized protein LOC127264858 isoform X2 [Andrographis paniculata]